MLNIANDYRKSIAFFLATSIVFLYLLFFYSYPLLAVFSSVFFVIIIKSKIIKDIYAIVLIVIFSIFISIRDIYLSVGVGGYGSDIIHYLAAFEELARVSFSETFLIARANTSSNDIFFWSLSYILSNQFSPNLVWFLLSFISLMLIYVPLRFISSNGAVVCLFCYVCSITFYTSQGSALRQSLAFSLFLCSTVVVFYFTNRKFGFLFSVLSISSHGSGFVSLFNFIPHRVFDFFDNKKKIIFLFVVIPIIPLLLAALGKVLPENYYLVTKISSRLEYESEVSWYWIPQFILENMIVCILFIRVLKIYNIDFVKLHFLFLFVIFSLMSLPEIGTRLYRYSYAFFMLHLAYYLSVRNNISHCFLICISFLLWWFFLFYGRYDGIYYGSVLEILNTNFYRLISSW